MPVELNHTIVVSSDKRTSAAFLADLLGLEVGEQVGSLLPVVTSNGVSLDYADDDGRDGEITPQHYAFLVSEDDFDAIFARIRAAGLTYYADPEHGRAGQINTRDGGRGTYFDDPDGHVMEILTRPYGSGG